MATIAPMHATVLRRSLLPIACGLALLGGCTSPRSKGDLKSAVYQREAFTADETFSRLFDTPVAQSCEAARRALLSQGYIVSRADERQVVGSKRFQPEGEVHVELSFNIVCATEGERLSTLFVSAQQDKYVLKKNPNAASIGVSAVARSRCRWARPRIPWSRWPAKPCPPGFSTTASLPWCNAC